MKFTCFYLFKLFDFNYVKENYVMRRKTLKLLI